MKYRLALALVSALAGGCAYESSQKLFNPVAPGNVDGVAGSTTTTSTSSGNSSSSSSTSGSASVFNGAWGSSTIAGLPLGNCSEVKWLINSQSDTAVSGTVKATCASGITVSAVLTGTLTSADKMNLAANGTLMAMGLPCQFALSGTGTRTANDTMKVDYTGSYCLGNVSGSENLRKFPV